MPGSLSMGTCASSSATQPKPIEDVMAVVNLHNAGPKGLNASATGQAALWSKKRVGVACESSIASHVNVIPKSEQTKAIIAAAIRDNMLFQDLPPPAMEIIIGSMHLTTVPAGTDIIRQGDTAATEFYVIEEGTADVWVQADAKSKFAKVMTYQSGSAFGELALLYNAPRAATVRATSTCKLWVLERAVLHTTKRNFTHEAFASRHKLLDDVPSLKTLSAHHKALLVDALQQVEFKAGTRVFAKGDPGTHFYIIREGSATVRDGNTVHKTLGPKECFGERALLGGEVRAADVLANTRLVCFMLSAEDFAALLGNRDEIWRFEALQQIPLLYNLNERQLWQLAHSLGTARYAKDQMVFLKGDPGDMFYIVQEGMFSVYDGSTEYAKVGPGQCFGELALLNREPRAANVIAMCDSMVLTLSREQFTAQLGNLAQLRNVWRLEALRLVPLLSGLAPKQLVHISQKLQSVAVRADSTVIKQGEVGDMFFIVEHGKLGVYKTDMTNRQSSTSLLTYGPGSYFGELALLRNEPRAATVRALTDVSLLALNRADFRDLLNTEAGLEARLLKEVDAYLNAAWKSPHKAIDMDKVHALAVLGAGGFGQVLLVKYQNQYAALKCVAKAFVQEQGLVTHIKREKDSMIECESPFLVRLHGTAQDDQTLYMMMDAVMGGELFSYLQSRSTALTEDHARFYLASVICALQYLHDKELVYRDLKPENLLLDLNGYVLVTDFGFVKRVKRGTKTYTLCGTPEYLAPEIIMNKGHNHAADWWAVGVLAYELVAGAPPFMDENRLVMFKKTCGRQITWPKFFSPALKSLIDRLLDPNPVFRLGSGRSGAGEIKNHPFFQGFDWTAFTARQLPAPYKPKQPAQAGDPVNFKNPQRLNHVFRCKNTKPRTPFDDF